eukprot:TRINITY_DN8748_c0_g1_i1.p1 TRINITY_DN8748_c0_g1~~TRINITY_DN8748_c0_g1_i1.p1  ORF type:complete len:871 (+),score=199.84 TRINITY_DN8748_c0_g1_i1:92-2614(+)
MASPQASPPRLQSASASAWPDRVTPPHTPVRAPLALASPTEDSASAGGLSRPQSMRLAGPWKELKVRVPRTETRNEKGKPITYYQVVLLGPDDAEVWSTFHRFSSIYDSLSALHAAIPGLDKLPGKMVMNNKDQKVIDDRAYAILNVLHKAKNHSKLRQSEAFRHIISYQPAPSPAASAPRPAGFDTERSVESSPAARAAAAAVPSTPEGSQGPGATPQPTPVSGGAVRQADGVAPPAPAACSPQKGTRGPCRYFRQGHCARGSACDYSHSEQIPEAEPASPDSPQGGSRLHLHTAPGEVRVRARAALPSGAAIVVAHGDITNERVDCLVNAANRNLTFKSGVGKAIRVKGGPRIEAECEEWLRLHGQVARGQHAITGGGELPCRLVLHVARPKWQGGEQQECELLQAGLRDALRTCAERGVTSLACPALSAGLLGFADDLCAQILIDTAHDFLEGSRSSVREVRFTHVDSETTQIFEHYLAQKYGDRCLRSRSAQDGQCQQSAHAPQPAAAAAPAHADPMGGRVRRDLAGWTFKTSLYKKIYDRTAKPEHPHQVDDAVARTFDILARESNCSSEKEFAMMRSALLESITMRDIKEKGPLAAQGPVGIQDIFKVEVRAALLWTAGSLPDPKGRSRNAVVDGRQMELCRMVNYCVRTDRRDLLEAIMPLIRALTAFCNTDRLGGIKMKEWPKIKDFTLYRGGSFQSEFRDWFKPGRQYRCPGFLATSTNQDTAKFFIKRTVDKKTGRCPAGLEPVMWHFVLDRENLCEHVTYLDRSLIYDPVQAGAKPEEDEFLFAPYSSFTVKSVDWKDDNDYTNPSIITVQVHPDNRLSPEDLPNAPWS